MSGYSESVQAVRLDPVGCISEGWNLIKDQYGLFLGITFVGVLLAGMVPFGIIAGPMYCGIFLALFMKMRREPIEFATLFKGFDYFLESLIVTLLIFVLLAAVMIPFFIAFFGLIAIVAGIGRGANMEAMAFAILVPALGVAVSVLMLLSLFLTACMWFAYLLLVDRNLRAWPALTLSAKAVWANKWGVLGLMLLNWLLSAAGALLCYIGLVLYFPIMFASFAVAYRRMFGESAPPPAPII